MNFHRTEIVLILTIIIVGQSEVAESCEECNKTYIPPCNMKYPYGDENEMNADVSSNDTNKVVCEDKQNIIPTYGRCPFPPDDPNDMQLTDPYIDCPEFPPIPAPGLLPVGVSVASASALCKSCDVKLTPDGTAVNLRCVGCKDLPSIERPANLSERDLIYTTYYVEIANYTSVEVQGRGHFNP